MPVRILVCIFITLFSLGGNCLLAQSLRLSIGKILSDKALRGARVGVSIMDADTGRGLFGRNENRQFIFASNVKLVTTAAALDFLGPDYTFRTSVYVRGELIGNTLNGDLIVKGRGDPNISGRFYNDNITAIMECWAEAIKKAGITRITGDIIADDLMFDRQYVSPYWPQDQLQKWYCAEICALSFNDNCIEVWVSPGISPGDPARVTLKPNTSFVTVRNTCLTASRKSGDRISIYRPIGVNIITVGGWCWKGAGERRYFVTVHDPALFFVTVFKEVLEKRGIAVGGRPLVTIEDLSAVEIPENEIAFAEHKLRETIAVTNKRSQNFYAEQILKTLGAETRGFGTFKNGILAVEDFLEKVGIPRGSYTLVDGSGLAKKNRLAPVQITKLLCYMRKHRYGDIFLNSLARPGEDGSLRKRMLQEPCRSRVYAKTGYVSGASALSGYVKTRRGRMLAFSIIMNDYKSSLYDMRRIQDSICRVLVDY